VLGTRSEPAVWGVYLIGPDAFSGSHPAREAELRRLYPDRAHELVCVALMPDAARARRAVRVLEREGLSSHELLRLFGSPRAPNAHAECLDFEAETANSTREPITDATLTGGLTMEVQPTKKTKRDFTSYRFDGDVLGKGRLALAIVKRYVADHPGTTAATLKQAFPDSLQAASPIQYSKVQVVVAKLHEIPDAERKRFFLSDGEVIALADGEVAVSREWNRVNILNLIERAEGFGYSISAVVSQRMA
jgi:hypothetical protein